MYYETVSMARNKVKKPRSSPKIAFFKSPILRFIWCLLGAGTGISLALFLAGPGMAPFLLASLGASTVFLFGLTKAPAGQPRALFGGHLGCAFIGICCYQAFGDVDWVYPLAQVLAVSWMLLSKTVHPPAGSHAIIMVYAHAIWEALLNPVLTGVMTLAIVAAIWSRLYPGHVRYPVSWRERSPPKILWGGWDD